jgi:hypothetical protein
MCIPERAFSCCCWCIYWISTLQNWAYQESN